MGDTETVKHPFAQTAVKAVKAMIVAVNEESIRQAMDAGQCNMADLGTSLRQPLFYWNGRDEYIEWKSFEIEITYIFLMKYYELSDTEEVPIIQNCLRREGLQFIQH